MRGSWGRRMERMVVKRMRKQHKGEGRGGWVDIEHCDEDTCITNSKYTKKISTQNYRKVDMPESLHPRKVTLAM